MDRNKANEVCCHDCIRFIPDTIGSGDGLGSCKVYDHYHAKGYSQSQLRALLIELGNSPDYHLFWGGHGKRKCSKFNPIHAIKDGE